MVRFTKAKGQGLIAFLRVLVAMDVTKEILPLEKIFGGVSKINVYTRHAHEKSVWAVIISPAQ